MAYSSNTSRPILLDGRTPRREGRSLQGYQSPSSLAHQWPQRGSTGWQLRHKRIVPAVVGGVKGSRGGGVVVGVGLSRHVSLTNSVHRYAVALIETRSAQE